jgi:hypothetical protein
MGTVSGDMEDSTLAGERAGATMTIAQNGTA